MNVTALNNLPVSPLTSSTRQINVFDKLVKNIQSLFKAPQVKTPRQYVEISPYGFISTNYIEYMAQKMLQYRSAPKLETLSLTKFNNGGLIIEGTEGHLIELDKNCRIVLVRVLKRDAECAKVLTGASDYEKLYNIVENDHGEQSMYLPAGIKVVRQNSTIKISMPDGVVMGDGNTFVAMNK